MPSSSVAPDGSQTEPTFQRKGSSPLGTAFEDLDQDCQQWSAPQKVGYKFLLLRWSTYRSGMESYLREKDLWGIVNGEEKAPSTYPELQGMADLFHESRIGRSLEILKASLPDNEHYIKATDPAALWKELVRLYKDDLKEPATMTQAFARLANLAGIVEQLETPHRKANFSGEQARELTKAMDDFRRELELT